VRVYNWGGLSNRPDSNPSMAHGRGQLILCLPRGEGMGIRKCLGKSLQLRRAPERFWKNQFSCGAHFVNGHARGDGSPKVYRQPRRLEK
jgi:hypothetical protein